MPDPPPRVGRVPLLALLLAACSGQADPSDSTLGGRWVSTLSSTFVDLDLRQAGSRVTGRAELAPGHARVGYAASGSTRGPELTLSLLPHSGGEAVSIRGALAGDTLTIRLHGGGFSDRLVPLVRMD